MFEETATTEQNVPRTDGGLKNKAAWDVRNPTINADIMGNIKSGKRRQSTVALFF